MPWVTRGQGKESHGQVLQRALCRQPPGDGYRTGRGRQGSLSLNRHRFTLFKMGSRVGPPSKSRAMLQKTCLFLFSCSKEKSKRDASRNPTRRCRAPCGPFGHQRRGCCGRRRPAGPAPAGSAGFPSHTRRWLPSRSAGCPGGPSAPPPGPRSPFSAVGAARGSEIGSCICL